MTHELEKLASENKPKVIIVGSGSGGINRSIIFAQTIAVLRDAPFEADYCLLDTNRAHVLQAEAMIKAYAPNAKVGAFPFGKRQMGSGCDWEAARKWYEESSFRDSIQQFFNETGYIEGIQTSALGMGTGTGISELVTEDMRAAKILTFAQLAQCATKQGGLLPYQSQEVGQVLKSYDDKGYAYSIADNDTLIRRGVSEQEAYATLDRIEAYSMIQHLSLITNPTRLVDPMDFIRQGYVKATPKDGEKISWGKRIRNQTELFHLTDVSYTGDDQKKIELSGELEELVKVPDEYKDQDIWNANLARAIAKTFQNRYYILGNGPIGSIIGIIEWAGEMDSADRITAEAMLQILATQTTHHKEALKQSKLENIRQFNKLAVYPHANIGKVRITLFISSYTGWVSDEEIPELNLEKYKYEVRPVEKITLPDAESVSSDGMKNVGTENYEQQSPPDFLGDAKLLLEITEVESSNDSTQQSLNEGADSEKNVEIVAISEVPDESEARAKYLEPMVRNQNLLIEILQPLATKESREAISSIKDMNANASYEDTFSNPSESLDEMVIEWNSRLLEIYKPVGSFPKEKMLQTATNATVVLKNNFTLEELRKMHAEKAKYLSKFSVEVVELRIKLMEYFGEDLVLEILGGISTGNSNNLSGSGGGSELQSEDKEVGDEVSTSTEPRSLTAKPATRVMTLQDAEELKKKKEPKVVAPEETMLDKARKILHPFHPKKDAPGSLS